MKIPSLFKRKPPMQPRLKIPVLHLLKRKQPQTKRTWWTLRKKKPSSPLLKNVPKTDAGPRMSEAQKRAIYNLSRRRGISVEDLEKMALESYGSELETLTSKDASTFIRNLQQAA